MLRGESGYERVQFRHGLLASADHLREYPRRPTLVIAGTCCLFDDYRPPWHPALLPLAEMPRHRWPVANLQRLAPTVPVPNPAHPA